ncbi:MAG: cytochrome c-type biogenesis CcmF C-terminal domain-containing protein, partial [Actinomycetota bacterium]
LVAWRRDSGRQLWRRLAIPLAAGTATVGGLAAGGTRSAGALFALGLCSFVGTSTLAEFVSAARAHRTPGAMGLVGGLRTAVRRNRRRYGGYVVHLGVVLVFLGIAGGAFKQTWSGQLVPGDRLQFGNYELKYVRANNFATDEKMVNMAVVSAARDGGKPVIMRPQRNLHFAQRQPQSEIALHTTLAHDLYLVLTDMEVSGRVTMRAWINPLVVWIWIGGAVMAAGMLILIAAKPPAAPAPVPPATARKEKVAVPA